MTEFFAMALRPVWIISASPDLIPVPDDGLFCNGEETCDEEGDSCVSSGNPCQENLRCDEAIDACVDCTGDAECDDGLFCNGFETCVNEHLPARQFPLS